MLQTVVKVHHRHDNGRGMANNNVVRCVCVSFSSKADVRRAQHPSTHHAHAGPHAPPPPPSANCGRLKPAVSIMARACMDPACVACLPAALLGLAFAFLPGRRQGRALLTLSAWAAPFRCNKLQAFPLRHVCAKCILIGAAHHVSPRSFFHCGPSFPPWPSTITHGAFSTHATANRRTSVRHRRLSSPTKRITRAPRKRGRGWNGMEECNAPLRQA